MLVLIITTFEFEELKSNETIYVELNRDLVSVTLVSILPYLRLRNSKMRKELTYHSRVT